MDLLEKLAEQLHDGWMDYQLGRGVIFGPTRTATTHPHLVPWSQLDLESQSLDRFIAASLLEQWACGRLAVAELPMAIHEAWRRYVTILGRSHPHAKPFTTAHPAGAEDHAPQALRAESVLKLAQVIPPDV